MRKPQPERLSLAAQFNQLGDVRAPIGLGNDIASGEMQTARAKLADIRATWQAITPQIADLGKDVNDDLQRLVQELVSQ